MNEIYEFIAVYSLVIIIRVVVLTKLEPFKSYFSEMPQGDASVYFMLIQFWRTHRKGQSDTRCLITDNPIYYPNLFEKVMGKLFNDRILLKYSYIPNLIIFCLALGIYMILLGQAIISTHYYIYGMLLFLLWIDHVAIDKKRIHFVSLQPRYTGAVICSLYFASFVLNSFDAEYLRIGQIIIIAAGLNISIFSRQALVFISLLLSIFIQQIDPLANLIAGLVINILIQGKAFVHDLRCEYEYHVWFYKNYSKMTTSNEKKRNAFTKIFAGESRQIILYAIFILMLVVYTLERSNVGHEVNKININNLGAFVLSIILLVFLTSLRKLAFLGESFRYISFSSVFIMPYIGVLFMSSFDNIYLDLIILILLFLNIKLARKISGTPSSDEVERILKFFRKIDVAELKNAIWFGIPYSSSALPMLLGYGHKSMLFQIGNQSTEIMKLYFQMYPFLSLSDDILRRHAITHILLDKSYLTEFKLYYDFHFFDDLECFEDDNYAIYKVQEI